MQNATGTTVVSSASATGAVGVINSTAFSVEYSVIQVAIGIMVGLFLAALAIYPLGKGTSGLLSFWCSAKLMTAQCREQKRPHFLMIRLAFLD